jgi:hypothetical protein
MGIDRRTISRTPETTFAVSESGRALQLPSILRGPRCGTDSGANRPALVVICKHLHLQHPDGQLIVDAGLI